MYNDNSKHKYYILVKDGKIIKAGRNYISKVEHLTNEDVIHSTILDLLAQYPDIDESKTINNKLGGSNEILYFYTE